MAGLLYTDLFSTASKTIEQHQKTIEQQWKAIMESESSREVLIHDSRWLLDMFNPCYCLCKGLSEAANGALLLVPVTLEEVRSREIEL